MLRKLSLFGILSPLFYLLHVVLGGILWKGYNHLVQPISDLTAAGAPDRGLLEIITAIYGICGLIFAVSAFLYARSLRLRTINISLFLFIIMSLITLSYNFFPQDMPGTELTFTGFMHLAVTGLIVPVAILSPLMAGIGFKRLGSHGRFSVYSIVTSAVIFISGGMSVIFIAQKVPYFGLVERINIGALQIWTFILALVIFTLDVKGREA